jgi:uncharacterized membrane protein YidH (DUF202 family)
MILRYSDHAANERTFLAWAGPRIAGRYNQTRVKFDKLERLLNLSPHGANPKTEHLRVIQPYVAGQTPKPE